MAFMQVSRKVDYALRAVIHLANEEANAATVLGRPRSPLASASPDSSSRRSSSS